MADFRRLLYAFAIVALLVGITVPASAQQQLTYIGIPDDTLGINIDTQNHDAEFGPEGLHIGLSRFGTIVKVFPDGRPMACDLLFPWVVGDSTFTTSIVIANTSLDPLASQGSKVTFWYFDTASTNLVSQTSTVGVAPGSYLAHVVSPSSVGTTPTSGLAKLSANFAGYVIAQAQFQYCQGTASISANMGSSETQTYTGLVLGNSSP